MSDAAGDVQSINVLFHLGAGMPDGGKAALQKFEAPSESVPYYLYCLWLRRFVLI